MKITRLRAFQLPLLLKEGSYSWGTQSYAAFDSTVVLVDTDEGLTGAGEICALGPAYMPSFAEGAAAGIGVMAPGLMGVDPTAVDVVNHRMAELLKGHPYAKSAVDMACWDLLGKATGRPVYQLLGGSFSERVRLFRVISRDAPQAMVERLIEYREEGFVQFQMKVGDDAQLDIERMRAVAAQKLETETIAADANTSWRQHEGMRVVAAVDDLPLYLEQPCATLEECLVLRKASSRPFILDEVIDSKRALLTAAAAGAMDVINLKISRFGGLTGARQARDLAVELGITMTIEDTWGGEIATAAIAHLARSTPPGFHFQSSAFHDYNTTVIADGGPRVADGHMTIEDDPGLGVTPDLAILGDPIIDISA